MSSSSLNPWGGATEPAHPPLKRIAPDGSSYTEKDFAEWYGPQYRHWWDLASPSDQEPQDHGAPTSPPNPTQSAGASSPAQKGGAQGGAAEHSLQAPSLTLQCPACKRVLCQTSDLAFVRRVKQNHGVEVHLMLKPENDILDTFKPTADGNTAIRQAPQTGTPQSWSCACGAKLGHTRPATVNRAHITSFKSADVMLCGHHFTAKNPNGLRYTTHRRSIASKRGLGIRILICWSSCATSFGATEHVTVMSHACVMDTTTMIEQMPCMIK